MWHVCISVCGWLSEVRRVGGCVLLQVYVDVCYCKCTYTYTKPHVTTAPPLALTPHPPITTPHTHRPASACSGATTRSTARSGPRPTWRRTSRYRVAARFDLVTERLSVHAFLKAGVLITSPHPQKPRTHIPLPSPPAKKSTKHPNNNNHHRSSARRPRAPRRWASPCWTSTSSSRRV